MNEAYASALPPSVDDPVAFLFTVFGTMLVVLFFSEWAWRLVWSFAERPAPFEHAITANRIITLLLVITVLVVSVPTLYLMMKWPDASVGLRWQLSRARSFSWTGAGFTAVTAWVFARRTNRQIEFALRYDNALVFSPLKSRDLRRTVIICVGAFVISFATAFAPVYLGRF